MVSSIVIELNSSTEDVTLACVACNALFTHYSLPKLLCYQLELCIDEILNNIIEHDLGFETGKEIRVQLDVQEMMAEIKISYYSNQPELGPWKDKADCPDARTLPERGFGCFLVNEIMDEVEYKREGDTNIFTLSKNLVEPSVLKLKDRSQDFKEKS